MKPKIAYILNVYPHGQTHIVNELRTLESNNIDVHIIAVKRPGQSHQIRVSHKTDYPVTYLFESENTLKKSEFICDNLKCFLKHPLTYIATAVRSFRWMGSNFKLACRFARILDAIKPTLVYVNWSWSTCGSVMYACRILRLPFIFSVQGTDILPPSRNFSLRVNTAQRIITPSPAYVKILNERLGVPLNKIRLVPNCLATDDFHKIKTARTGSNGSLRLLYIGTLRPVKRHEDLIQACFILQKEGIDVECQIFGEGPDRSKLELLISQLELTKHVKLKGHVSQEKLIEQLEDCDIYVHTSESEAFAHAILEAQASARPVIVADGAGGMRDSVIPGETAIVVPVGKPGELAKAIIELANDPEKRLRMGQVGREFVRHNFSHEHFGPKFLKALLGE